ncbi:metal ABC transporter permease [Geodermatophilus marinus]|nr:metal ABC transporter permease [Geodermatophilus sp. LHW52908]
MIDALPLPYTDAVVATGAAVLGLLAGLVGVLAVLRRRTLVGDALSHAALPGVAVAFLLAGVKDTVSLLVGAAVAGTLAAVLVLALERSSRVRPDTAIGVVLSGSFSLGIVLLTHIAATGDAGQAGLQDYLFGQAAGLVQADVTLFAALAAGTVVVLALLHRPLTVVLFDAAFARSTGLPIRLLELVSTVLLVVAVVVGLRTVGAILMVAMIVVPAVAARQVTGRLATMLVVAGVVGAAVGTAGSLLSTATRTPTGPVVVLLGAGVVLLALSLAPGRGVLWHARRLRRDRRRRQREGVLVDVAAAGPAPVAASALGAGRPSRAVRRTLRRLRRDGLVRATGAGWSLTAAGQGAATAVLARRELWWAWLEHGAEVAVGDAREPDPDDLAGSLGAEAVERLRALGGTAPAVAGGAR